MKRDEETTFYNDRITNADIIREIRHGKDEQNKILKLLNEHVEQDKLMFQKIRNEGKMNRWMAGVAITVVLMLVGVALSHARP